MALTNQALLVVAPSSADVLSAPTSACVTGVACASAAGAAEPIGTTITATAPGDPGPKDAAGVTLGTAASPQPEPALRGTLGAAHVAAADTPSRVGTGEAQDAQLEVTLTPTLLAQLPPTLATGLEDALGAIAQAIAPIVDQDPTGTLADIADQLTVLLADLGAAPLMAVDLGGTTSDATHQGATTAARSTVRGSSIVLVPTPESTPLAPVGLITIEVSDSNAEAATDARAANADFDAASIRVTMLPGILDATADVVIAPSGAGGGTPVDQVVDQLPPEVQDIIDDLLPSDLRMLAAGQQPSGDGGAFLQVPADGGLVVELPPGQAETCFAEDTPLEICVMPGGGQTTITGAGAAALASAASVSAIRMQGLGVVELDFSTARAGVNAAFAQTPASPTPTPTRTPTRTPTPATGPGLDLALPAIVILVLSGLSLAVLRRRP